MSRIGVDPGPVEQGQWANILPEILVEIIGRIEQTEADWPARRAVVLCASICRTWRNVTKQIVKTPEECARLTFPISLKQPGPRGAPIQCFIKRSRKTSTYRLCSGLIPSDDENDKVLLSARKVTSPISVEYVFSLVPNNFSRSSCMYIGKLRSSNVKRNQFTLYDHNQSPGRGIVTIVYEFCPVFQQGRRRMHCMLHSIPASSILDGGTAPTPTDFSECTNKKPFSTVMSSIWKRNPSNSLVSPLGVEDKLLLKNKTPVWNQRVQAPCLDFRDRVTVPSVKNFQLIAAVDPSVDEPATTKDSIILQFGKIGKDTFTMDYRYPLSAFQAFAICLTSFGAKSLSETECCFRYRLIFNQNR